MKKIFLTLNLVVGIILGVCAQNSTSVSTIKSDENANAPVITFESTVYDYGDLQKGGDGKHDFIFKNTGMEPLILTNVSSS